MSGDTTSLKFWLWKHGLPMHTAQFKFGHPELVGRCKAAMEIPILPDPSTVKPMKEAGDVMPVLQGMAERAGARADAFKALETSIVGYLKKDILKGLGFELPRRLADDPAVIPQEAWGGRVDFTASTVKHAGIDLVEVRLIATHWETELTDRWFAKFAPAPTQARRGPLGTSRQIEAAYAALRDAKLIDFSTSMARIYPQVRRWMQAHYPKEGFSDQRPHDETLRKTISPMFAQDRDGRSK